MASGIDKILKAVLKDRTSTPLYSSLLLSWCLWNTQIIYATIFVGNDSLPKCVTNKLDYILSFANIYNGIIFPFISAAAFIFIFPYVANYTYRTSLKFKRKRLDDKANILLKDRLLTLEQSVVIKAEAEVKVKKAEDEVERIEKRRRLLDEQLNATIAEKNSFKVLIARYGSDEGNWIDVTSKINKFLTNPDQSSFVVGNDFFGQDPPFQVWKDLDIVYQSRGEIRTTFAKEEDHIKVHDSTLMVTRGQRSDDWKAWIQKGMADFDSWRLKKG